MGNLTISGGGTNRLFNLAALQNLTIDNIALKNGYSMTNGGAALVAGNLILNNVLLDNNLENVTPKSMTIVPGANVEIHNNVLIND